MIAPFFYYFSFYIVKKNFTGNSPQKKNIKKTLDSFCIIFCIILSTLKIKRNSGNIIKQNLQNDPVYINFSFIFIFLISSLLFYIFSFISSFSAVAVFDFF